MQIRKQTSELINAFMEASSVQFVFDLLIPSSVTHKNWRVRQLVMECCEEALSK